MTKLRDGWNITGDITNSLEATCRKVFSLHDAAKSVPSIFDSAALSLSYFIEAQILVLRKISNYQTIDEIENFISTYSKYFGRSIRDIGDMESDMIFKKFNELLEIYEE